MGLMHYVNKIMLFQLRSRELGSSYLFNIVHR